MSELFPDDPHSPGRRLFSKETLQLIDWLIESPLIVSLDWSIDWLIESLLIVFSIDWLIDWLIGYLFAVYFLINVSPKSSEKSLSSLKVLFVPRDSRQVSMF